MKYREVFLSELAKIVNSNYIGNDLLINGLGLCNRKTEYDSIIAYTDSVDFLQKAIENQQVKALVTSLKIVEQSPKGRFSFILSDCPEETFYKIHQALFESYIFYETYGFKSIIGNDCKIHSSAVIEDGVKIGNSVIIGANSVVNKGVSIGNNSYIGCCSVIGSEGFQILRNVKGVPYNVRHVGGTVIGNNVWIGDNVTVGNAIFEGAVQIGDNCKIDNHTYIAHNSIIGEDNVITAGVIMLGSSEIKNNCWLAPGSVVMNRVIIENRSFVGANSMVNKNVREGETVVGSPAISIKDFTKIQYQLKKTVFNTDKLGMEL